MAAIERKINGTFAPVPGGYAQQTSPPVFHTTASIIISVRSATISRSSAGAVYPTTSSAAHTPSPAAPMTSSKSSTA